MSKINYIRKLNKLLKRDISFRRVEAEDDMKWLWAAYRKEAFSGKLFPKGLDQSDFKDTVIQYFSQMSEVFMLEAVTSNGKIPVGIVSTLVFSRTEPHVDWFPWASSRNKLETVALFLSKMRNRSLLVWAEESEVDFYTRIAQYGVLRRVGKLIKFKNDKDHMLFQTRGS